MAQAAPQQPHTNKPPLSAHMIASWSQHLRDGKVFDDIEALLLIRPDFADSLLEFLHRLDRTDVSRSLLIQTRIHFALREIFQKDSGWDVRVRNQAEATLIGWQALFGDLDAIAPDPWAEGNQLAGVFRLKTKFGRVKTLHSAPNDTWIVKKAPDSEKALTAGHNGFRVGKWWINSAAAFRDGMILAFDGITAGESFATAIVLSGDQENFPVRDDGLKYRPSLNDPNTAKILRNLIEKKPIRVLRSQRLRSPLAPYVGLRYDGLYRVEGYKLNLCPDDPSGESLQYTFEMERDREQPDLARALEHPAAEERDLWDQYVLKKHLHEIDPSAVNRKEHGLAIVGAFGSREGGGEREQVGTIRRARASTAGSRTGATQ